MEKSGSLIYYSIFFSLLLVTQSLADLTVTGPPGPPGDKGEPGAKGAAGPTGQPGDVGPTGVTGQKGEKGIKGEEGVVGSTGLKGDPGFTGLIGSTGASGNTGIPGPPGLPGATGSTGEVGATGGKGVPGVSGQQGAKGLQAGAGQKGMQGTVGEPGEKGGQGEIGLSGAKGPAGVQGPKGIADVNECLNDTCPASAVGCENNALGFDCICERGYTYNKGTNSCDDIDECSELFGNCDSFCKNVIGSYSCSCLTAGLEVSPKDKHSCIDINECQTSSPCLQEGKDMECINTYGSYVCVDMTPLIEPTVAGQTGEVSADIVSEPMIIVLVVWAAFLTLLFIIIIIILIMKRENYITEQKSLAKSIHH